MSLIFIISLAINLFSIGWVVYLARRIRGWRLTVSLVMLVLITISVVLDIADENLSVVYFTLKLSEVAKFAASVVSLSIVGLLTYSLYREKEVIKALTLSEKNFRNSIDNSPLGITIASNDGKKNIYANRALLDIFGYSSFEELVKTPLTARYTSESSIEYQKRRQRRQLGDPVSDYQISIIRKDGEIRHLECFRKAVLWNGKQHMQILFHDITKLKEMQEELIMQDRMASIGLLVSGVAHEMNNPLNHVIGFSDLLLDRDLPGDIKSDVTVINSEAKRAALVVKNLLTFARKQPQIKQPIDVNQSIQAVLQLRTLEQNLNNIKVITRFAPDLPQILGNYSQLQQVFFNIIINAEFFISESNKNGTITIKSEQVGDSVRISIADNGPGISKEHLKRLFNPFFTTKAVGKGTGLGLSICHGIIIEHGGKIRAESVFGKGATFIIDLPSYHESAQIEGLNEFTEAAVVNRR